VAGVNVWEPTEALRRSRRRTRWLAAGLSILALLWLAGLGKDGSPLGVVILEVFTLAPLVVIIVRLGRLRRLLGEVETVGSDQLERQSRAMQAAEEQLLHVGRLVAMLPQGGARDAGSDAVAAAEKATEVRRLLLRRRDELSGLAAVTRSPKALKSLKSEMRECETNLGQAEAVVDNLAASVARLVAAAEHDADEQQLAPVRDATERTAALAAALDNLSAPATQPRGSSAIGPAPEQSR